MRALYAPPDDNGAGIALMATMGMTKAQIEAQLKQAGDTTWIWPCNWKPLHLFIGLSTQWRVGMAGITGLDYAALPIVAQGLRIRLKPRLIRALQVMEREALRLMSERREG